MALLGSLGGDGCGGQPACAKHLNRTDANTSGTGHLGQGQQRGPVTTGGQEGYKRACSS